MAIKNPVHKVKFCFFSTKLFSFFNSTFNHRLPLLADRLVLLGNHRDGFGATDASSGMATLMEISRQLGKMRREG